MKSDLKNKCIRCGKPCRMKYCLKHAAEMRAKETTKFNQAKAKNRSRKGIKLLPYERRYGFRLPFYLRPDTNGTRE